MALFSNNALTTHPYLIRMPRNDREWTGFIQALNEQSIDLSGNDADIRDIVGAMFVDSETINFTYNGSTITAVLQTSGIDHNDLSGLTAGDPHTQYLTPTRLASAFVDGTDIDFTVTVTGSPPNETVSITAEPSSNVALLNRSPQEWTGDNYFGGDLGISGSVYVQVTEAELVALGGLPTSTALNGLGSALLLGVAGGGNLRGGRVNGTLASPTAVGSGNGMFAFDTWGYDGSQMALAARINFLANGAWTGTNHGVFARLSLTERDTTELSSFVEFRYDSGAPSVRGLDGSASAPFWTFLNDTDTGIYRSAADTLGISAGGTNIASFGSSITTLSNTVLLTKSGGSLTQAALVIASASPNLLIHETDQAADAGLWVVSLAGGEFRIGAVPDNFSGSIAAESRVMNVTRSGSTVGNISLGNSSAGTIAIAGSAITLNGVNVTDYARLSQSNDFTGTNQRIVSSNNPAWQLTHSGANTDEGRWAVGRATTTQLNLGRTLTDDGTGVANAIVLTRSGTTITSMALAATAITLNGVNVTDYARLSQRSTFTSTVSASTGGAINLSSSTPSVGFFETDGGADEKNWLLLLNGGNFRLITSTDAAPGSVSATPLAVQRGTGTAVASITLTATALALNGTVTIGTNATTPTHRLNTATSTTVGAAGSASALPATPEGYIAININGTVRHIPYYAAP